MAGDMNYEQNEQTPKCDMCERKAVRCWLELVKELPNPDYVPRPGHAEIHGDWSTGNACEEHSEQVKRDVELNAEALRGRVQ